MIARVQAALWSAGLLCRHSLLLLLCLLAHTLPPCPSALPACSGFTPTCMAHPDTYLNKVVVGSEEGQLQVRHRWRWGALPIERQLAGCNCRLPCRSVIELHALGALAAAAPASSTRRPPHASLRCSSGTLPPPAGCTSLRGGAAQCAASRPLQRWTWWAWAWRTGEAPAWRLECVTGKGTAVAGTGYCLRSMHRPTCARLHWSSIMHAR